jgi:hypothetical protein
MIGSPDVLKHPAERRRFSDSQVILPARECQAKTNGIDLAGIQEIAA